MREVKCFVDCGIEDCECRRAAREAEEVFINGDPTLPVPSLGTTEAVSGEPLKPPPRCIQIMSFLMKKDEPEKEIPAFMCPACNEPHWLDERWKWNGDFDKPTFGPASPGARYSYLQFTERRERTEYRLERPGKVGQKLFASAQEAQDEKDRVPLGPEWQVKPVKTPARRETICHSHIKDGVVTFCGDQPGGFANKSIPLKPWSLEEWQAPR